MLGFVVTLIIAALVGWIGDALVKDKMPGGFWGALLAGIVGAWIGAYSPLLSTFGPNLLGIALVPAILGAVIFVFFLGVFKNVVKQTT